MTELLRVFNKPKTAGTAGFYLEIVSQNIRYALRGFRASPLFTLTILATLMMGIGATTAVFSVVDRILFRPLPYAHADRLVSLGLVQSLEKQEFMVGGFYFDWRDRQQPFAAMSAEQAVAHECDLTDRNPAQLTCSAIEAGLLPMLGVSPLLGRNFLPEEDRPHGPSVALLSYSLWRSRFNRDPGVLNRVIEIDGDRVRVVGVLPQDFELPSLHVADVLLPLAMDEGVQRTLSPGQPLRGFARLKPGVSIEQARLQMEPLYGSISRIIPAEIRKDFHLKIRSLRDRQMDDVRPLAWVLLGTVIAVLLIACANVASLLLARGASRARELAVRSALGASRSRLAGQAITEAVLLALAGAAVGCGLAELLLHILITLAPPTIPYLSQVGVDFRIVGCTVAVSLLCGLVFGLAPAWAKPDGDLLSARFSRPISRARLRQGLVVVQIAASMVLLAAAGLLARSFWNLEAQQLGMRTQNTITAAITLGERNYSTNQKTLSFFQQLTSRLRYGPDVTLVAVSDSLPPGANHNGRRFSSIGVAGKAPAAGDAGGVVSFRRVSPDYFKALEIPLLRGEGFTEQQVSSGDRFVVLSKTLAERLFPGENPLGQRLQFDRAASGQVGDVVHKTSPAIDSYLVTGVAADVKNAGLTGEDVPEYYLLRRDRAEDWDRAGAWGGSAVVILRTSRPAATMFPWIRGQVAALDPTLPVDIASMQQRISKLADAPRFQTSLVGCFAAMGLVLAVVGIYGVISFLVTQRTQEIGVRIALGASRGNILRLVAGTSMRLIAWGTFLGLIAAFAASRVLASLLFGVSAHDPITFLLVALLLVGVALLATLLPARFATRVDPIVALRYE